MSTSPHFDTVSPALPHASRPGAVAASGADAGRAGPQLSPLAAPWLHAASFFPARPLGDVPGAEDTRSGSAALGALRLLPDGNHGDNHNLPKAEGDSL